MTGPVVVVSTVVDPASANIAEKLLESIPWDEQDGYLSSGSYRLIILEEEMIYLRDLDHRLKDLGLNPDLVVFASRHQSKDKAPRLCGHFTGNSREALMGGNSHELAVAAPGALKSFLSNLAREAPGDFLISAEATHHGPTDMRTPSFFAEIGSTEREWSDPAAGMAVARSILNMEPHLGPVFLGFGGGHYVRRQSRMIMETGIAFGHLFSNYQVDDLDLKLVEEAQLKSGASYAYLDRKSLRSKAKRNLSDILDRLGLETMNERDIGGRFPHPG